MATAKINHCYVDVDMVLGAKELRNTMGRLCVQGPVREYFKTHALTSLILTEVGPGGGNAEVRVRGSRTALLNFLNDFEYDPSVHAIVKAGES
jgi:hypothetical protein